MRHGRSNRRIVAAGLFAFAACATAACSFLLDTSAEQCKTSADCDARGGGFAGMQCVNRVCVPNEASVADTGPVDAGPWGCLGDVSAPKPTSQNVNVVVPLVELVSQKPVTSADVFARVCAKIDVNCNSPIHTVLPDDSGLLMLTKGDSVDNSLASGFDGFILIDPILPDGGAPSDAGDAAPPNVIVPSIVFLNPPLVKDQTYSVIVMVRTSSLAQIAQATQTPIDPSLGAIFMQTTDCNAHAAAGVSVALDSTTSKTQGFYFQNNLPVKNAPATDVTGYAGFVNVSLSTHTITGTLEATQQRIGTATVFTAQSMISYTVMAPSP